MDGGPTLERIAQGNGLALCAAGSWTARFAPVLEKMVAEHIPAGWQSDRLAQTTGDFHRRMVELSGNATLAIIAGMLHEITVRHTAFVFKEGRPVSKADYDKLMRSYGRLMKLLRAGDGAAAEAHWRKHLDVARELSLQGLEDVKVRDVMG